MSLRQDKEVDVKIEQNNNFLIDMKVIIFSIIKVRFFILLQRHLKTCISMN